MKKLLLGAVVLVAGLFSTANAQIQEGNWMVGSSLLSSNFGLNTGAGYDIALQPKAAYFIKDNVALGGYVNLGISKVTKGSPTRFDYGVGALGRYYISPGEAGVDNLLNHGRWFFEGNLGVGGSSVENGNSTTGLDFGVGPGYSYFITPNIGIEGLVKYVGQSGFGNEGLNSNITFNVGFSIYLPSGQAKRIANEAK
ncbi:hypothetical protein NG800_011325 [Epilithonimonas ginsengisoli]|uniref:Porin family protein n=1 Tax=Epilithonimonas ginsengisoli TaxID=1245592 RepID=A0ABU4JIR9_9FLAO|nr:MULTISPECIES: hypothetical protein [Chryseobacterium group]MBV6879069.1 hypothetical protein [Epilithonimonas sp. FP105]MDW8549504.1 hypothetical protein [Epilithonimonas ginsengisoli]OAH74368.1 hypothetical protein AXA65_06300 [Chryseobacterium sp. FP211-J200]